MKKSKATIQQILAMHKQGVSIRKISRALKLSRNTVRGYIRDADQPAIEVPEGSHGVQRWDQLFPWDEAISLRKRGVTCKQIYNEMQPPVSYSRFSHVLSERSRPIVVPSLRLGHEAAQRVQIDFADGPLLKDPKTGAMRKTQLFCAVLPFSSYTYAEIVFDQKLTTFIGCHQKMWAFFGGVTPICNCR